MTIFADLLEQKTVGISRKTTTIFSILVILAMVGCGGGGDDEESTTNTPPPTTPPTTPTPPPPPPPTPAPTVNLTASPTTVSMGGQSTLAWSVTDAASCTPSGGWSGSKPLSGNQSTGSLTATTVYTLNCSGNGGSTSRSVTVTVTGAPPTLTFTASPTTVDSGGTTQLNWNSTNTTGCNATGAWSGGKSSSGSQTTSALGTDSTFTLSCSGSGGSVSRSVSVLVNPPPNGEPGATVATHHETIPNPVFGSTHRVSDSCKSVQTPCTWGSSSTWATGSVPASNSRVIVDGKVVISGQSDALHVGIYPGGELSFNPSVNTRLSTGDLIVFEGGSLMIGTQQQPIASNVVAELQIRDLPYSDDPKQHLRTLLSVNGKIRIQGRQISQPFIKASGDLQANSQQIQLQQSVTAAGWQVGDQIVIPRSAQCEFDTYGTCNPQTESHTINSISGDGLTITLSSALQHKHPGARNTAGQLDFFPYVLNMSRNVLIRSENPNGNRAHTMLHGRSDVMIRYAKFKDMGRTNIGILGSGNQKGRYPLHAHHLIGPTAPQSNGYQFTIEGNVIDFGADNYSQNRKWGLTVHGSHYGLVQGNIVDYASGAAIVTEDGSESFNDFHKNFVVRIIGGTGERLHDPDPGDNSKLGRAGVGYWFNGGGNNSIRDNVAADIAECIYCYGFKFDNVYNNDVMVPLSQGADPHHGGGQSVDSYDIPIDDFVGNETYASPNGLTIWWVCAEFETPHDSCASRVEDFKVWHFYRWGYFGYEVNQLTLDGFTVRGDASILGNQFESSTGLWFGDYMQRRLVIENADIQGVAKGIELPSHRDRRNATGSSAGVTIVRNSLINAGTGISILPPASINGSNNLAPMRTMLENVDFSYPSLRQSRYVNLRSSTFGGGGTPNLSLRNDVFACNYDTPAGQTGSDIYFIPSYQGSVQCDSSVANCGSNISSSYPDINTSNTYPAAANCN